MIGQWLLRSRESALKGLGIVDTFDAVYKNQFWGDDKKLSGPGSYGTWAREYVEYVCDFVAKRNIRTLYDAGCGDFNVGAQIAPCVARYIAADISETIVKRNQRVFAHLSNVEFQKANICDDPIPSVDLVTVRQVFQHLTNEQIEAALCNIEKAKPRFVIVADHIARPGKMDAPNLDLPFHTIRTRVTIKSGVVLSAPPFCRHASLVKSIPGDSSVPVEDESVLAISVIELP